MMGPETRVPRTPADRRKWLVRLIWVRVVIFSCLVIPAFVGMPGAEVGSLPRAADQFTDMATLLAAVCLVSLCWYAVLRLSRAYVAQSYGQIAVDLLLITWAINVSGGLDSTFSTMYFLEVLMAGVLLPFPRAAFVTALVSSLLHAVHMDLAFYQYLPSAGMSFPSDGRSLLFVLSLTVFGLCTVGYLTDVLAAKWQASNVALRESTGRVAFLQALTSHIIDSLGAGLITTDLDGRIYLFNPAAARLSGCSAEEAVGSDIHDVFPEAPADIEGGQFELTVSARDGKNRSLHFSVTQLAMSSGVLTGRVWVFDDVTELREMEKELGRKERMAVIGSMSAGIAHEIRNPLASITGSLNLLRSLVDLGPEEEQLAGIVTKEAERLNQTINDFLTYARPARPQKRVVSVDRLLRDTVQLMRNSTTLRDHQRIEADLEHVEAEVDENMMRQVFYNLMSNGLKAMPDGGLLRVGLRSVGEVVEVSFADTGIGMTQTQLDELYVPFSSSFGSGTGLGLSIVYQIVTSHDGTIRVNSSEGQGTTVWVRLPRAAAMTARVVPEQDAEVQAANAEPVIGFRAHDAGMRSV